MCEGFVKLSALDHWTTKGPQHVIRIGSQQFNITVDVTLKAKWGNALFRMGALQHNTDTLVNRHTHYGKAIKLLPRNLRITAEGGMPKFTFTEWKYVDAIDIWGIPVTGQYDRKLYGGGGYIVKLDINRNVSEDIIKELSENNWIDRNGLTNQRKRNVTRIVGKGPSEKAGRNHEKKGIKF
ncbi:hypothetical protein CHS0354_020592 [Potamilus streckersoni]|uniref:Polycystin domain-containing protein n=1 Tax=Potamilus streckersoni TaxID=2493646 RepID=A0AAE0VIL0_9BIVA|nr:hypothetical protein CHS0354_020592 [Potamilus streckersoni]